MQFKGVAGVTQRNCSLTLSSQVRPKEIGENYGPQSLMICSNQKVKAVLEASSQEKRKSF